MATKVLSDAEEKAGKEFSREEKEARNLFNRGSVYLNSSYNSLQQLFDLAYSRIPENEKHKLNNFFEDVKVKALKIKEDPKSIESINLRKEIIERGVDVLKDISPPQIYKDLDEFAREKTIETFSNIALSSYKKFKDKSPIISIENPPAGSMFSRGEDLKEIVEGARKKFVEKAIKEGIDEKTANESAKKLIGVTWDVGHINMLRKYGYGKEDLIKETEKVAPLVKHIHLSDNFGFDHTELPMGMGNVPMKEIMDKLGKEGFDAKKIIEAGNWWQHFKTSPFQETLEAFGSPVYAMNMAPYWNQDVGLHQDYYPGLGQFLPQKNYETFGTGFSQLPMELGGQRGGAEGNRMSGRPME